MQPTISTPEIDIVIIYTLVLLCFCPAFHLHEHAVSKYCTVLGTSLSAAIAHEDRVALNVLRMRTDVEPTRLGCVGLSGGGLRAALMRATSDELAACVIVGMMSTYEGLLSDCVAPHTRMLFPAGWSEAGDWPDLAASAAPSPLLVQFLLDDRALHRRRHAQRGLTPCGGLRSGQCARGLYGRVLSRTASLRRSHAGGGACLAPEPPLRRALGSKPYRRAYAGDRFAQGAGARRRRDKSGKSIRRRVACIIGSGRAASAAKAGFVQCDFEEAVQ